MSEELSTRLWKRDQSCVERHFSHSQRQFLSEGLLRRDWTASLRDRLRLRDMFPSAVGSPTESTANGPAAKRSLLLFSPHYVGPLQREISYILPIINYINTHIMKKTWYTLFILGGLMAAISLNTFAQTQLTANQEVMADSSTFDFWIGEWDLTWDDGDGAIGKGTNRIERIMGGQVIQENFEGVEGNLAGYKGMSVSVFNRRTNNWNQTWVDNQGGYLDFSHAIEGDKYMFVREFTTAQGQKGKQRMVFYDITKDSFEWDWEASLDGGKTWNLQWQIHYKRKK